MRPLLFPRMADPSAPSLPRRSSPVPFRIEGPVRFHIFYVENEKKRDKLVGRGSKADHHNVVNGLVGGGGIIYSFNRGQQSGIRGDVTRGPRRTTRTHRGSLIFPLVPRSNGLKMAFSTSNDSPLDLDTMRYLLLLEGWQVAERKSYF